MPILHPRSQYKVNKNIPQFPYIESVNITEKSILDISDIFNDNSDILYINFENNSINDIKGRYKGFTYSDVVYFFYKGDFGNYLYLPSGDYILYERLPLTKIKTISMKLKLAYDNQGSKTIWSIQGDNIFSLYTYYPDAYIKINNKEYYLTKLDNKNWYHLIILFYDNKSEIYLNNELIKTINDIPKFNSSGTLWLGSATSGMDYPGHMNFDQIRMFNKIIPKNWHSILINEKILESTLSLDILYPELTGIDPGSLVSLKSSNNICDFFGDGSNIARYTFDRNVNDLCGKYNGIWVGDAHYTSGKSGYAAKFDGNSYIKINNLPISKIRSISFWIKKTDSDDSVGDIISIENQNKNDIFIVSYYNGLSIEINNNNQQSEPFYKINTDEWYFITIIFTEKTNVYINGQIAKVFNEVPKFTDDLDFYIGTEYNSPSWTIKNMLIDELRIFNRPLTENEIYALYKNNLDEIKSNRIQTCNVFNDNSCIATYIFDGQNTQDVCGKNNASWIGQAKYVKSDIFPGYAAETSVNSGIVFTNLKELKNEINLSFWFKYLKFGGDVTSTIFYAGQLTCELTIEENDKLHFAVGEYWVDTEKNFTIEKNRYYFFSINYNKSTGLFEVYIDNQKILSDTKKSSYPFGYNTKGITFGISTYKYGTHTYGTYAQFDQIRIFNRTLSFDEIKTLYNEKNSHQNLLDNQNTTETQNTEYELEFKVVDLGNDYIRGYKDLHKIQKYIDQGYHIFIPHSEDEYWEAVNYLKKNNLPLNLMIMGIYYEKNGPGCCDWYMKKYDLNELYKHGWKSADGYNKWYIPNIGPDKIEEPNGDYNAYEFLGGWNFNEDDIVKYYNDEGKGYRFSKFLMVKRVPIKIDYFNQNYKVGKDCGKNVLHILLVDTEKYTIKEI
jgi:hypothetical protein